MLEPVIGLEIHVQLKTKTKMFCSCATHNDALAPNTNICPICLGHPGILPVPNQEAVRMGLLMGLALNCKISKESKFDRKNYFYPDLPKGYQISQFDIPVALHGHFEFNVPQKERSRVKIGITRAHLEEDAAKSFHDENHKTFVDFNRGGTPLIEIVTEPDFKSPLEAKHFLQELRLLARYLGVSDADMEKGHLRCDANISLREVDEKGAIIGKRFNPKTEIKNLNSFKHVERALAYEIDRQEKLWLSDSPPSVQTTRTWNDTKQKTHEMRSKEDAADYRYFPEPDLPIMKLSDLADELANQIPELPEEKRIRFVEEYALRLEDAKIICENTSLCDFTEAVFSELLSWLNSLPELDGSEEELAKEKKRLGKLVGGWLISKLGGLMSERGIDIRTSKVSPENFAEFITLLALGKLSTSNGLSVLGMMLDDGSDPSHIMEEKKLGKIEDEGLLAEVIDRILEGNPDKVKQYLDGKEEILQWFIGQVMKETEGSADPALSKNILLVKLKS